MGQCREETETGMKHMKVALLFGFNATISSSLVAGSTSNEAQCTYLGDCSTKKESSQNNKPPHLKCHTYMAPSTLGDKINVGMYVYEF